MNAVTHLLDSARGVYIPQNFCELFDLQSWSLDPESWAVKTCLSGHETDDYWDAWEEILNNAEYKDSEGNEYRLHQDGDLWAVCYERMTAEEKANFGWDEEEN